MEFLARLAESLGLPKDSPQDKVFAALAGRLAEGDAARESLSSMTGAVEKAGLRLDQGKLVKVNTIEALDLAIKPEDDEEKVALKKDALQRRLDAQKAELSGDLAAVEGLSKEGRLPPAVIEPLRKLVGLKGKVTALALSRDGKEILEAPAEARALTLEVLKALSTLPKMTAPAGLQRLSAETKDPSDKTPEALANEGKAIAARVASGRTKTEKDKAAAAK